MSLLEKIRGWAKRIKRDAVTLWFAYKHPGTPLLAKALCVFVVAYALSPIDLVPDFVPVLGYVDDALLLPALIWVAIRLMPSAVLEECRGRADEWMAREGRKPRSYWGAVLIVAIWVGIAWAVWVYAVVPRI
jgi:uncharacterized membrane protein YkvA (DUF1232 family)